MRKDYFLKKFKSEDELNSFLKELKKQGIETMFEGELCSSMEF